MKILTRHLFTTIFMSILVVLLVIVALDLIAKLVDDIGNLSDTYQLSDIFYYILMTTPSSLYEFMPFAALVGALIGLGSLAASSELVAMRAAGVSLLQISGSVMIPVLVFIGSSLFLGEYVIPISDQYSESYRAVKLGDAQQSVSRQGLWNREGDEFMYVTAIKPGGKMFGIIRYQYQEDAQVRGGKRLEFASASREASYIDTQNVSAEDPSSVWQEREVLQTQFGSDQTVSEKFAERPWESELTPDLLKVLILEPDALAMTDLYRYANYLDQQNIANEQYWLSFWEKLLQPLAMISLVLIAVSFVFGPLREVTMGFRIFTGVIVGVVFQMSQNLLGPASLVYGFSPFIAVILPILLCAAIGLFLLVRAR